MGCWSTGIFTLPQTSLGFTRNGPGKRSYPVCGGKRLLYDRGQRSGWTDFQRPGSSNSNNPCLQPVSEGFTGERPESQRPCSVFLLVEREQHKSVIICLYTSTQTGVNKQMWPLVGHRRPHQLPTLWAISAAFLQPGTEVSSVPFVVADL